MEKDLDWGDIALHAAIGPVAICLVGLALTASASCALWTVVSLVVVMFPLRELYQQWRKGQLSWPISWSSQKQMEAFLPAPLIVAAGLAVQTAFLR